MHIRERIWQKLAGKWRLEYLDSLIRESKLPELPGHIERMLQGRQTGRIIVNLL
jgi:hypothetical protein